MMQNRTIATVALSAAVAIAIGGCSGGKADPAPTASTTTESPIPVRPPITMKQLVAKMGCTYHQFPASQTNDYAWESGACATATDAKEWNAGRPTTAAAGAAAGAGRQISVFRDAASLQSWLELVQPNQGSPMVTGTYFTIREITPQQAEIIAKQTGGSILPAGN